jgi:hypothetical protein
VPSAEVAEDILDDAVVINDSDAAHGVLADRTAQRVRGIAVDLGIEPGALMTM